ncbi:MAG TPA: gas vesicle protein [Methanosarcinales archaeon]|nr:gas vesicle protein [Methanosarcinales archaeon]
MAGLMPEGHGGLPDAVERILDRGVVLNADISVSVAGTELLGIKIRAALASFETAARYGLALPSGADLNAAGWREADRVKASCPECGNRREERSLIEEGCPICGWVSPLQEEALEHRKALEQMA